MSSVIDYSDPANCKLHAARLTGGLYYTPRHDGQYSMYAPPCTGCTIGVTEQAQFFRRNNMCNTFYLMESSPSAENVQATLGAIADVIIESTEDSDIYSARFNLTRLQQIKDLSIAPSASELALSTAASVVDDAFASPTKINRGLARTLIGGLVIQGNIEEAIKHINRLYGT